MQRATAYIAGEEGYISLPVKRATAYIAGLRLIEAGPTMIILPFYCQGPTILKGE